MSGQSSGSDFDDFEVICVDDGSDGSHSRQNSRTYKERSEDQTDRDATLRPGRSYAQQELSGQRGNIALFLDGDDFFEARYAERATKKQKKIRQISVFLMRGCIMKKQGI